VWSPLHRRLPLISSTAAIKDNAMLLAISALKGYAIEATDGQIGSVDDFLFDDKTWQVRWLVVDTGGWLSGRQVLVHPSAIGPAQLGARWLPSWTPLPNLALVCS
jgi:PRC-barrel domain